MINNLSSEKKKKVGSIQNIVVFQSLSDGNTGFRLYEDTIKMRINYGLNADNLITHDCYDINSKQDLIEFLKYYIEKSKLMSGGFLIHFEMHGSENLTGLILKDGSLITWIEIVELLREININLCNKLYITMATCFGRHLYKGVEPEKKSPYSGYISASKEVTEGEVMEDFTILFESLISGGNLVDSFLELDEKGSKSFFYMDSKTTFESNIKSVIEKVRKGGSIRKEILDFAISESQKAGEPVADEEMSNFIFEKALKDIYMKHKKAFEFNC